MGRMVTLLLPLLLAAPSVEQCAAMLLSPDAEVRKAGVAALADVNERAVLAVLARRAHSRSAWIEELEKELPDSSGPRHVEVRELLRILRHSTEDNVGVDLVMVSLTKDDARKLLGEGLPSVVFRDGRAWDGWWQAIDAWNGAELVVKTSLPGKDAHPVEIERKRKISYVRDFEIRGNIASPVVDEVEAGLTVKWRPVLSRDGKHVTIDFDVLLRDIVRPIAVQKKDVGKLQVQVQVPEQSESRDRRTLTLPLGGCAAFLFPGKGENATVCFVRATLGAPQGVPELPIPEAKVGVVERKRAPG